MSLFRRFLCRQKVPKERYKEGTFPFLIYPTLFSQNLPTGRVGFAAPPNAAFGIASLFFSYFLFSKVFRILKPFFQKGFKRIPKAEPLAGSKDRALVSFRGSDDRVTQGMPSLEKPCGLLKKLEQNFN